MREAVIADLQVLAPNVEVVIKPASWMKKIDFVNRIILDNNVMISLLGEQGSGKTTFANVLKTSLPSQVIPYTISVPSTFDETRFLEMLSTLLGSKGPQTFAHFVAQRNDQKLHTLLIIDDAHHLSPECIENCLKALQQQGSSGFFHVFLISNFSLITVLNTFAQAEYKDMIHSIEVGPLTESETKSYVQQRLQSRHSVVKGITDERVNQFYTLTGGHLLEINRQMARFFNVKTTGLTGNKRLFRHLSVAVGVLLAITGTAFLWNAQSDLMVPTQLVQQQVPTVQYIVNGLPEVQIEGDYSSDIPAYYVASVRQSINATPLHAGELVGDEENDKQVNSMVIVDKVIVAPKVLLKHALVIQKSKSIVVAHSISKPKLKSVKLKPLIEQTYFTIQLLASHRKDELNRFIQLHHMNGKARVRLTKRAGVDWYVLTIGEYAKRETAKQAVSHLPKDIVAFRPWVRPIGDLKG